jgi:hypothetical protein
MGRILGPTLVVTLGLCVAAWADERKGAYEVHDLSLWVVEPTMPMANSRANFPSAFPPVASSSRLANHWMPQPGDGTHRIAPFGMITFYGQPTANLDVDLRTIAGSFLAHWPAGESLPNRLRWTGTPSLDLVEKVEDESDFAFVDEDHWFRKARRGEALFVRRGARAERFLAYDAELGLQLPLEVLGGPDKYTLVYTAGYTSGAPLHDVLITRSTPQGCRVAWIDTLSRTDMTKSSKAAVDLFDTGAKPKSADDDAKKREPTRDNPTTKPAGPASGLFGDHGPAKPAPNPLKAAPPEQRAPKAPTLSPEALTAQKALLEKARQAGILPKVAEASKETPATTGEAKAAVAPNPPAGFEVTLSDPLPAGSPEATALTTKALSDRLQRAGLSAHEAELFVAHYEHALFGGEAIIVLCRLDPSAIEEKLRLSIFPEPAKTVRVAMVLMRNVDPQFGNEIERLVAELGHVKYSVREAAQNRLTDLGSLAFAPLYNAIKNPDLEVVMRAERILLNQNQSLTAPPQAVQPARGVLINKADGQLINRAK